MSSHDTERVLAIARLARINLTEGQSPEQAQATLDDFAGRFTEIVQLMDTLTEVDTEGVEALYQPLAFTPASPREDVAQRTRSRSEVLANAPDQDGNFFIVPRIV